MSNARPLVIFRRIVNYARRYRGLMLLGMIGIIGSQLLASMIPNILRFVVDRGIALQDKDFMLRAGLLVVGLGILRGLMGFAARYFTEAQSHYVAYDLRNEMYNKVQRLAFSYHDTAHTGSLITRSISDVDEIQRFLAFGLLDGLNTLLIVGFSVIMMFYISVPLAIIASLPLIPLLYRSKRFAEFVDAEWRKVMEHLGKLGNFLQESIVGAEVVRAFAREPYEVEKFGSANQDLYEQQLRVINEWSTYIPFSAIMTAISVFLVLVFGGLMEQNQIGGVTVGVIVQFNAYILTMAQPVRFAGFVIMTINQGIASGRRVFEILDAPEAITDKPDAMALPPAQGIVQFEKVNFRYTDKMPYALQNINLTANPDQVVAILGKTGSGKSTLVSLIPRFYDVTEGRITIDGYDIRDVTMDSLKRQIGIVLQESLLFSATIRENIAFGRPDADENEIIAAAKAANAHDFIMEFPDQYETLVGERGITLSGGQRQRIAIARALLINPRILILDDSTSSVDTRTEFLIQEALQRLMKGRTTFVIAQRLTTVMNADEIIVLQNGAIAERGQHHDLLKLNGLYREIYDLQLADQERARREAMMEDVELYKLAAGD